MFRNRSFHSWLILLLFLPSATFGQGTTGQIAGTVTDPNGAVVAGAAVKVTNIATNYTRETTTNGDGIYGYSTFAAGTLSRRR